MSKMNPGGDQPADGAPVWMKYLGKGAGVVGGGGEHLNQCYSTRVPHANYLMGYLKILKIVLF